MSLAVSISDIEAAAVRLAGHAVRTPLLTNARLDEIVGGRVFLKAEILQHTGAFKFRGAYSKLSALDPEVRARGVVAWSSGNHAQAVADAARRFGTTAVIVMPSDAPRAKIEGTKARGGEVRLYDRWTESREEIGHAIAAERGLTLVPPFDDPLVIAGQGTAGLEMAEQAKAAGVVLDHVLVPCSGGGLVTGIATALADRSPTTKIWSVEPAGLDDMARSLRSGHRETNDTSARSICDALMSPAPGEITFPIAEERLSGGFAVSDEEVLKAMAFAFHALKLVVEPGGATTLAAVLSGKFDARGANVGLVLSGGNVDAETFQRALETA